MNKKLQIIKNIMAYTGHVLAFVHAGTVCNWLLSLRNYVYTGYLRDRFALFGRHSVFHWQAYTLAGEPYIYIGDNNIFERGIQLTARKTGSEAPVIRIGDNCLIRACVHITAINSICIGDNLLTGTNVLITDNMHGSTDAFSVSLPPRERTLASKGNIIIGNNVWLGNNVCVMPGVTIGNNVVIGANSVVTHDIPENCVAAGIPAKVLKKTNTENKVI